MNKEHDYLKNISLLYIEDELELQVSIQNTLEFFFKEVFVASDGEEAIQVYKEEKVDLVLLDIEIPKFNGLKVSQMIKDNDKDIPIIILSAYSDTEYLFEAIRVKVEDYLIKPFDLKEFLKINDRLFNSLKNEEEFYLEEGLYFNPKEQILIDKEMDIEISLGKKEALLLELLLKNQNEVVTKQEIDKEVWNYEMTETSYRNLLRNLRKKVGENFIKTVLGVGLSIDKTT